MHPPKLWGVYKDDTSLASPHPLFMEYLSLYTPEQTHRHEMRPVLPTGRNTLSWEEKFALELDLWYVDNYSLWIDIKILCLTIMKVLTREGIRAAREAKMPKFTRNGVR